MVPQLLSPRSASRLAVSQPMWPLTFQLQHRADHPLPKLLSPRLGLGQLVLVAHLGRGEAFNGQIALFFTGQTAMTTSGCSCSIPRRSSSTTFVCDSSFAKELRRAVLVDKARVGG